MLYEFSVKTNLQTEMIDITDQVQSAVDKSKIKDGVCIVFIPHTTAAVTINENADPTVQRDIMFEMNKVVPFSDGYKHSEGNSAAHIKSSMFGVSSNVIINNSRLLLGTWQGIYFCEFDGPRHRKIFVKIQ